MQFYYLNSNLIDINSEFILIHHEKDPSSLNSQAHPCLNLAKSVKFILSCAAATFGIN